MRRSSSQPSRFLRRPRRRPVSRLRRRRQLSWLRNPAPPPAIQPRAIEPPPPPAPAPPPGPGNPGNNKSVGNAGPNPGGGTSGTPTRGKSNDGIKGGGGGGGKPTATTTLDTFTSFSSFGADGAGTRIHVVLRFDRLVGFHERRRRLVRWRQRRCGSKWRWRRWRRVRGRLRQPVQTPQVPRARPVAAETATAMAMAMATATEMPAATATETLAATAMETATAATDR